MYEYSLFKCNLLSIHSLLLLMTEDLIEVSNLKVPGKRSDQVLDTPCPPPDRLRSLLCFEEYCYDYRHYTSIVCLNQIFFLIIVIVYWQMTP